MLTNEIELMDHTQFQCTYGHLTFYKEQHNKKKIYTGAKKTSFTDAADQTR
jgi:alpha-D-ribose 1-methylphosphonate 5-triphosphate diphosphatase PhnM